MEIKGGGTHGQSGTGTDREELEPRKMDWNLHLFFTASKPLTPMMEVLWEKLLSSSQCPVQPGPSTGEPGPEGLAGAAGAAGPRGAGGNQVHR